MNSACLLPYCPLPVNSGARSVFSKHINLLNNLGRCEILSARNRPVGYGWLARYRDELCTAGFKLSFRSASFKTIVPHLYGLLYAVCFKSLKKDRAFGHSNPYHRYAFSSDWLYEKTQNVDLCEIHYSYWARLKTACPKVVIVHDLWSSIMWEGSRREVEELKMADLVVTVSGTDSDFLLQKGVSNVLWSPPVVEKVELPDSKEVVIVGSDNYHNQEGISWFISELTNQSKVAVNVFGAIANTLSPSHSLIPHTTYQEAVAPYCDNGIVLMTTALGTGIQIKAIEALAYGRAIVAREGSMRGLPSDGDAWLETSCPSEMIDLVEQLQNDSDRRLKLMANAREYYEKYLNSNVIKDTLSSRYRDLC